MLVEHVCILRRAVHLQERMPLVVQGEIHEMGSEIQIRNLEGGMKRESAVVDDTAVELCRVRLLGKAVVDAVICWKERMNGGDVVRKQGEHPGNC